MLTELRRAGSEGLDGSDLQEKTGVGPGDLRTCLAELITEGSVEETDTGWALSEGAVAGVLGQPTDWDDTEAPPDAPAQPVDASEATTQVHTLPPALEGAGGPVRARIVVDVMFLVKADEDPLEVARSMTQTAVMEMGEQYPDLQVSATLDSVDQFESTRRIYPADE